MTPIFRYVGLTTGLHDNCHAREFETNHVMFSGKEMEIYDDDDRCTYNYRILRTEGTVYNKADSEITAKATVNNTFVVRKCYENNPSSYWEEDRREVKVA